MPPDQDPDRSPAQDGPTQAFLRRAVGRRFTLREIAGDASTRRFYRVRAAKRSFVLMVHSEPLDPASSLYSNHRILSSIGAPVPRLVGRSNAAGLVLVEDLGDTTLQRRLVGRPAAPRRPRASDRSRAKPKLRVPRRPDAGRPQALARGSVETRRSLYRQACDLIVLMQTKGTRAIRPGDFAAKHALDRERFLFELDHFHRHYVRGLRGLEPGPVEEELLRDFYEYLAGDCDRMRRVYCHRDFQSRNLMLYAGRLRLVDFQDARMGPYTYDAASLLRDSSLDLDEELVQEMLGYLAGRLGEGEEELRRDFDRMALQRNIKDLGTFAYMATVRGLASYVDFVPRTIHSVKRTLLQTPRFHFVHPLLERYVLSYPS